MEAKPGKRFAVSLFYWKNSTRGWCYDLNCMRFSTMSCKNWRFSQKPMLGSKFCIIKLCFEWKTPIIRRFFWRKHFKNHNIGPSSSKGETDNTCGNLRPFYFGQKWP
jgi:hypothetical protein